MRCGLGRAWIGVLIPVLAAGLVVGARTASAHGRSTSSSSWTIRLQPVPEARIVLRVAWNDLQRSIPALEGVPITQLGVRPDLAAATESYLTERLRLYAGDRPCALKGGVGTLPSFDPNHIARVWRVRCARPGPLGVRIALLFDESPAHLHLARLQLPGEKTIERIFVSEVRNLSLSGAASDISAGSSSIGEFLWLGVEHIATGFDHMAFLLALLLVSATVREVVTMVTGFTLAHSITLALAVLGVVTPRPAAVEALIGLSIVVVAVENFALTAGPATRSGLSICLALAMLAAACAALFDLLVVPVSALAGVGIFSLSYLALVRRSQRPAQLRWFVAFVFGLIHGLGFAGVLAQTEFPAGRVAASLLGFNLGVELGQLALVVALWPILRAATRRAREKGTASGWVQVMSTPILSAGIFWFLTRAIG